MLVVLVVTFSESTECTIDIIVLKENHRFLIVDSLFYTGKTVDIVDYIVLITYFIHIHESS